MHEAFMLVETDTGMAFSVADEISKLDGVETAQTVTGPYDVIAHIKIGDEGSESLKSIAKSIHSIDGISYTMTSVAVH